MSSRKVTYVRFQTPLYIPNVGDLGNVQPGANKNLNELSMVSEDTFITMTFSFKGIKKELRVPHGNIVAMELAPEEPKKSK